ncbi:MAG: hypothetical protein CL434_06890 [Acidimicrobiaceae bacterium]|jgi:hypothetical protein|nr:hypothetical protein [Acidimicrobiaceae bacterium]|tara:strand:+ start:714 stop:1517 length:804 start_codon:yes stop_codon:yes gene_type:complete
MLGIATRYFAGRVALATAAAVVLGLVTGMDNDGHIVMFGTIVLGTAAVAFALLAGLAVSVGDGDSIDRDRSHNHPATPAWWPLMGSLGLGILMVGLVTDGFIAIVGISAMLVSAVEWTFSSWAEHLSTDQQANSVERNRLLAPFEIPLYGALAIALPVVLVSRILLTSSKNGASLFAIIAASLILAFAFLVYAKPELRRSVVASLLVVGGLALIIGGIAATARGERDFHHPGGQEDHGEKNHVESDDAHNSADEHSAPVLDDPVVIR